MKRNLSIYLFAALISIGFSSCEKFLDVNDDPNNPVNQNLPLSAKLPAALLSTVNQEAIQLNQLGSFWGGYWGTNSEGINQYFKEKTYDGPSIRHQRDGIPIWENGFQNLLYYQLIKEQGQAEGAGYYSGISKIMQGWTFLRLVDIYNNIPFDDALQGTKFPTPRYEGGQVVYQKSINLITDGINEVKAAGTDATIARADIIFNGSKQLWAKFGNTIKLRALIRQSQTNNQAYIAAEIQKIQAEGSGYLELNQNATLKPGYENTAGKINPFWETYYRNVQGATTAAYDNLRPTSFLIDQYKMRNDPRMAKIYQAVAGDYKGVLFGNPTASAEYNRAATSALRGPQENGNAAAGLLKSALQPLVLMGSFESLFLQAEAAQRGWIAGSAKTFYEQGIQASFTYNEVPTASFAAYNAQPSVDFDQATDKISAIITQKWLSLNSINGIEAWSDYRRLGLPAIPNSLGAPSPAARPLRLMYPESERQTNNAEASRQGGDQVTVDKVWWNN
ncbi:SusD/RagB family nutrient-binding outer membrane lipoprotein [Pedobacter chinensis]|uniref:SusD/RagB family nutrient-binding outer membrane lipoprotein n=1 Tax=Pedobacter chinensis TaxID=2282421 RepID=A0A369PYV9_9SPHI|nr:SusD/RagB family nutrient-binding outer membrane lipoprotein [Pedobacter chinensis]RDC56167.1 SusD/RagB family nutrient-binding outer membrane lipoprotein [Pedobacter chinensis]